MSQKTELRVFISSAFRDLNEERDHLVRNVFPEIRTMCRERGVTFTEVDPRWGVTEEVTSGQAIRTCLEEVDRTRPYFLGITGSHYGSVPDATQVATDPELTERFPWIEQAVREGASLTDLEFRHGVLNEPVSQAERAHARFYFRQRLYGRDAASNDRMKLIALENKVRSRGFNVKDYRDPEDLGEKVRADLIEIIERDFAIAIVA